MRRVLVAWASGYVGASVYRRWRRWGHHRRARDRFMSPPETWTDEDHADYSRYCRRWDRVRGARDLVRGLVTRLTFGIYEPEELDN
ncbi:hypothetical protein CLV40_13826 [Actinokineospora auranticolor]|uniref:Uncharacterized protein n=1 Tax=Actinokineospora auranticolor TaxID=155976 RepID=A0A2S6GBY5_9PSEU|nr:hypothetical protein CLV40_13826 [Actinokineospora auranticolor]